MGRSDVEINCDGLGALFNGVITDMKDSVPVFEELVNKSTKLHSTLRASMVAVAAFLEAFQKVADQATNSKGATKEIGKSLTRLCLRHRSIENKLKVYTNSLLEGLVVPLQERLEDWRRNAIQLDKDHAKDQKKVRQEIKRAATDTIRLQKKAKKGKGDAKEKWETAMSGVNDKFLLLEDCEKKFVRKALLEERRHYCDFICCVRPVVDSEISMINEVSHLQEILDCLCSQAADPENLPEASEQVISDVKGTNVTVPYKTPPDSPTSERHSLYSSMNSLVSGPESDVGSSSNRSHSPMNRTATIKSLKEPLRLISIASQDSGFTSQDALYARPHTIHTDNYNAKKSHGSLEEEKLDSASIYSSLSSGNSSHDFDSVSVHSATIPSHPRHQTDRAVHTISGIKPSSRPTINNETYDPLPAHPQALPGHRAVSMSEYSSATITTTQMAAPPVTAPARPQRSASYTPTGSTARRESVRSLPPKPRAKPVALPSVPFMDTEPIYMNTQELAQRIAEKRKSESDRQSVSSDSTANSSTNSTSSRKPMAITQSEERQEAYMSAHLSAAVKELEASTAALHNLSDFDILSHKAQNDALADAIKELEASTAALNDCIDAPEDKRQSVVSSSGYGTTTSNSSASEEVNINDHEHNGNHNNTSHITDSKISEETTDALRASEGIQVTNWAGKATLRSKTNGQAKPPPPVRKSSSVTCGISMEAAARASQRHSRDSRPPIPQKPPVTSPKPRMPSRASESAISSLSSNSADMSFPTPPPPLSHEPIEGHYAIPMNCKPIDDSFMPPPPPEFDNNESSALSVPINYNHLPPPIPDSQPQKTSNLPPWERASHDSAARERSSVSPSNRGPPPPTLAKNKKLKTNFMAQLNATLGGPAAAPVHPQVPSSNGIPNPALDQLRNRKENSKNSTPSGGLLMQIQGGVQLKRTENVNDRSAPAV